MLFTWMSLLIHFSGCSHASFLSSRLKPEPTSQTTRPDLSTQTTAPMEGLGFPLMSFSCRILMIHRFHVPKFLILIRVFVDSGSVRDVTITPSSPRSRVFVMSF